MLGELKLASLRKENENKAIPPNAGYVRFSEKPTAVSELLL